MLGKLPILVVEDEPFVGLDLADAIQLLDGDPVGPIDNVAEALALLDVTTVKAAILDANLADRDVTPLALALIDKGVPFVIYTGTGLPTELAENHSESFGRPQACASYPGAGRLVAGDFAGPRRVPSDM